MRTYTLLNTFKPEGFYVTQGYGINSRNYIKYGLLWHEGLDLGDKADPNPGVRAVHDGVVVRDVDVPKDNYGDYVVIWDDVQGCATWYCHLRENYVRIGQRVKAGDLIGIMGSTGNVTGKHLHFNFVITDDKGNRLYKFKTKNLGFLDPQYPEDPNPPKYPPGVEEYKINWVDSLPSNQESMPEKKYTEEEMTAIREERDSNWNKYQQALADIDQQKSIADQRKKEYDKFREEIAIKLVLPVASDNSDILGGIERLLTVEDQLGEANKKILQEEKKHSLEKSELQEEINKLRDEIERQQKQNETLLARIDSLEDRINSQQSAVEFTNRFKKIFNDIINYIRKP